MIEAIQLMFVSILISAVVIIPELMLENWFVKMGYVRDHKLIIIIATLCLVLLRQIWFNNLSWWLWGPLIMLITVIGGNRGELGETIKHGSWWWKKEKRKKYISSK